jgi:ATP-dependent protease ClpP protease subunit
VSIDSPGGTTAGGEAIYEALRKLAAEKPVVAQVGTLAASAGYMIASADGSHRRAPVLDRRLDRRAGAVPQLHRA